MFLLFLFFMIALLILRGIAGNGICYIASINLAPMLLLYRVVREIRASLPILRPFKIVL